jgi:hypothetical protein
VGDGEDQVVVADLGAGQLRGVGGAVDEGDVQLGVGGGAGEDRGGGPGEVQLLGDRDEVG